TSASEVHRQVERVATTGEIVERAEGAEAITRIGQLVPAGAGLLVEQVVDAERQVHRADSRSRSQVEHVDRFVARDLRILAELRTGRSLRVPGRLPRRRALRRVTVVPDERDAVTVPAVREAHVGPELRRAVEARVVGDL